MQHNAGKPPLRRLHPSRLPQAEPLDAHFSQLELLHLARHGGGPHIRVFDGRTRQPLAGPTGGFFAYGASFTGGVWIAAGDVNGDGFADVITGADAGGGPHVRVFSGRDGQPLAGLAGSFFAFNPAFRGGVRVAAGDVNGNDRADIITAAGPGGGPHVRALDGLTRRNWIASSPTIRPSPAASS